MAVDALHTAIMSQHLTWVLDADIRSFFDSVDHERLLRMLAHRVADRRILRLIELWLRAGVPESDAWCDTDRATPRGAGISLRAPAHLQPIQQRHLPINDADLDASWETEPSSPRLAKPHPD